MSRESLLLSCVTARSGMPSPLKSPALATVSPARSRASAPISSMPCLLGWPSALLAINSLMVRERDPKRLLSEACKILVETRGYQLAWIGQVEPGSKRVVPAARGVCGRPIECPKATSWGSW